MTIDSVDSLYQALVRIRLLTPDQIEQVANELVPVYRDPRRLADNLVAIDWLTEYQRRILFEGDWNSLNIGQYQILDRLGEGGVSEVFKARDTWHNRIVALKVLRANLVSQQAGARQFRQELQAITRLSHPNVIKTYDVLQAGTVSSFSMEYVEGIDLHQFVATHGALSVEHACEFARQTALGLQHAHQLGLVHRDIKPANLFLIHPPIPRKALPRPGARRPPDPIVKILDWGLARMMPKAGEPPSTADEFEKGLLLGTADFVAPEQARNPSLVDTRADIYSLGCTLYYLLTARPPFAGTSLMQKLKQHQEAQPTPLRELRPDVPEELEAIVQRMMAKDPTQRFHIPLLAVGPLRRFCPSARGSSARIVRPAALSSTSVRTPKPATSPAIAIPDPPPGKPSSSAVLLAADLQLSTASH
jgi:serine/threonine-protein kinase